MSHAKKFPEAKEKKRNKQFFPLGKRRSLLNQTAIGNCCLCLCHPTPTRPSLEPRFVPFVSLFKYLVPRQPIGTRALFLFFFQSRWQGRQQMARDGRTRRTNGFIIWVAGFGDDGRKLVRFEGWLRGLWRWHAGHHVIRSFAEPNNKAWRGHIKHYLPNNCYFY